MATRADAGNSLTFVDEAAVRQALRDVRSDECATNWALVSYDASGKVRREFSVMVLHRPKRNKTITIARFFLVPHLLSIFQSLVLAASGTGGVDEMAAALDDARCMYGLFSMTAQFDRSTTTKHGFVKFIGAALPVMKKAALAPHNGFVRALFEPYHLDFSIDARDELSVAIATEKVRALMFTNEQPAAPATSGAAKGAATANVNRFRPEPAAAAASSGNEISFKDADAYRAALASVHQTNGAVSWLLGAASTHTQLELVASGGEGDVAAQVAAITQRLEPNRANFALLRMIDIVDGHPTTKFVYVASMPAAVPPMQKARLATTQASISAAHRPWHVDFFIEQPSELSGDGVIAKVGAASGSKNFSK